MNGILNVVMIVNRLLFVGGLLLFGISADLQSAVNGVGSDRISFSIPLIDLDSESHRQVVVDREKGH